MKRIRLFGCMVFVLVLCISTSQAAIQVLDSNYQATLYLKYHSASNYSRSMIFDSAGNMYISHINTGKINKIAPDGTISVGWSSGHVQPYDIVDASNSRYGQKLYVAENEGDVISTVDWGSNTQADFAFVFCPAALALDRYYRYNGYLFTGTTGSDTIYKISDTGQLKIFCSFFEIKGGGIEGLAFDPSDKYGGYMYAGIYSQTDARGGIHYIDTNGNATQFSKGLITASTLQFDQTDGLFGGDMYAAGLVKDFKYWEIYRVGTDGQAVPFMRDTNGHLTAFAFGPDGAMYVHQYSQNGDANIWRVAPIPEPATITLLGLGFTMLRRRSCK